MKSRTRTRNKIVQVLLLRLTSLIEQTRYESPVGINSSGMLSGKCYIQNCSKKQYKVIRVNTQQHLRKNIILINGDAFLISLTSFLPKVSPRGNNLGAIWYSYFKIVIGGLYQNPSFVHLSIVEINAFYKYMITDEQELLKSPKSKFI